MGYAVDFVLIYIGAARLRERVLHPSTAHDDECEQATCDLCGCMQRNRAAALDAYAAYEKAKGRVEALREIRDEAQRRSEAKEQGLWLALYESAIAKLAEAEQALRALGGEDV